MAIIIKTNDPAALLTAIKTEIRNGNVRTWEYNATTQSFTHTIIQPWAASTTLKAQIVPDATEPKLKFGITFPANAQKERAIYSILHGRFMEMLLSHFHDQFSVAWPTKNLAQPDVYNQGEALV